MVRLSEDLPVIGDALVSAIFSLESCLRLPRLHTGTIRKDLE